MAGPPHVMLAKSINDVLYTVFEIETTITDMGPDSQALLEQRIIKYAEQLRSLRASLDSPSYEGVVDKSIPRSLLKHIDMGGNPDDFTTSVFKLCMQDNQICKGKVVAVRQLHESLLAEAQVHYPKPAEEYKSMLSNAQSQR